MMRVTRRSYGTIGLAILVLLIALVSAGTVFTPRAHAESAAGDSFENAIPITLDGQVDVNVPNYDTPTYLCFTPSINATYRFYSTRDDSTGADPQGWLYEYNGSDYVQKAYNDDSGSNDFSITYTMNAGTTYCLVAGVYNDNSAGPYTVHLARTSGLSVQSADGEIAYFVRPGQSQTMAVAATTDEDLTITYEWYHLDEDNEFTLIEGATDASYTATMTEAGEECYKVVVTDSFKSAEVGFSLIDDTGSVSALTEEDAVALSVNETKRAKLPHGGACWFAITPSVSGFYEFSSSGDEDPMAELYNEAGDKLARDDDSGDQSNFYIRQSLVANQTYYLKVFNYSSSTPGCLVDVTLAYDRIDTEFVLRNPHNSLFVTQGEDAVLTVDASTVSDQGLTYTWKDSQDNTYTADATLTVPLASDRMWFTCTVSDGYAQATAEFTVYDAGVYPLSPTMESARELAVGEELVAGIQVGQDAFFVFEAPRDGNYTFYSLTYPESSGFDPVGNLLDEEGNQLASNDDTSGKNFSIERSLSKGQKCYLRVEDYGRNDHGTLKVGVICDVPIEPFVPDGDVISYDFNDGNGDGWTGCAIEIVDTADNSILATLTINYGNHAEGMVSLTEGHVYQFLWKSGSYASECSFTFKSGEETILEGGGSGHANGDVLLTYAAGIGPYESYDL